MEEVEGAAVCTEVSSGSWYMSVISEVGEVEISSCNLAVASALTDTSHSDKWVAEKNRVYTRAV
jgi:hypothetical protein